MSRYSRSEDWLHRAEKTIPLGSQTFSKSRTQYPVGISPLYIDRAQGCYVWDIDGNKYIDFVSSLASVTIGYNDPGVNSAVKKQLRKGVSFSLPGKLEAEVAELICEMVPSAEMVRFGKNGTDATSAAVRLARAYTGRNTVLVCGYHGWQDWFIGSTSRNKGVPASVSDLTKKFVYNDIESLKNLIKNGDIACVVMEPMNLQFPSAGYLEEVRRITSQNGIILIFDETITGFRFSKGGAQELFGVIPDLSTFGKGMANGFPLSAVVGKKDIMMEMETIFFSGTFGGELLSLAACKAVLELHELDRVVPKLIRHGIELNSGLSEIIASYGLKDILSLSGHETWKFLNWKSTESVKIEELKTYFWQKMFESGLLVLNSHNVTLSHTPRKTRRVLGIYELVLRDMAKRLESGDIRSAMKATPLAPLFSIR